VKRRAWLVIVAVVVVVSTFLFAVRHYRLAVLTSSELAQKLPRAPESPKDCSEVRRAVALSSQSIHSGREQAARITVPLDADEIAIYKEVVQQWNSTDPAALNVSARTFPLDTAFSPGSTECGCSVGFPTESLLQASHSFHVLNYGDLPAKGVRVVFPDQQDAILGRNDPNNTMRERPVKEAVENAFANGLFSMSEIVFDREHRRALVSYSFHCGALCGNGATWIFEKVNGEWKKTDQECGGWVS